MELKPGIVTQHMVGSNTNQHLLNVRVLPVYIMNIICGYHRNTGVGTESLDAVQHRLLLIQTVILYLKIIVPLPEHIVIPQGSIPCGIVITAQQTLCNLTCQAGRKAD